MTVGHAKSQHVDSQQTDLTDVECFVVRWQSADRYAIDAALKSVIEATETADGEVAWWRATTEVASRLRRSGGHRAACRAASRTHAAVLDACERTGVAAEDRSGTTRLARAAGDAARALLAGARVDAASEVLLGPFAGHGALQLGRVPA